MYVEERSIASHWQRLLQQELAERLIKFFGETKNSESYLVRGLILTTDLDGSWEVTFPEHEISGGSETMGAGQLSLEIRSAFHLLLALGDFAGAQNIVEHYPDAFITPGLKGWRFATRGFLNPGNAVEMFNSAADSFAEDVEPSSEEIQKRGGCWDAKNITLWTKYFRARAAVARIVREPDRAQHSLTEASELLEGTDSGFVHNQVWRFRVLVGALLQLLRGGVVDVDRMRQELLGVKRLFGVSSDDPIIEQFVDSTARAFEALRANPEHALIGGELHMALETLGRIPLLGSDVTTAIGPAIGARALAEILGPHRTWIHRTLEAIGDEAQLRKIILRLAQAELPRYAQIRHGPLEYGKDVVAVLETGGHRLLRMWQVKVGDITMPKWRESRAELEEMYLVTLASLQIGFEVNDREGILVCNGHANPNVEPVMSGWFAEQEHDHHRVFSFVHLNGLVNWIVDHRLVNELRAALQELGIHPIV